MLTMNSPTVVSGLLTVADNTFLWDGPCDYCSCVFLGNCALEVGSSLAVENNTVGMHVEAPRHASTTVRSLQAFALYLIAHSGTATTIANNTVSSIYDAPLYWDPSVLSQMWVLTAVYVSVTPGEGAAFRLDIRGNDASLSAPTWLRSASYEWKAINAAARIYANTSVPTNQAQHMLQIKVHDTAVSGAWINRTVVVAGNKGELHEAKVSSCKSQWWRVTTKHR